MFEKAPAGLKLMLLAMVVMIGPAIVLSLIFGGIQAMMIVLLGIVVCFTVVYIVGVRKYM